MAEIVQGLFGVSPELFKQQQDAQFQQQQIALAQLDPQQQRFLQMGEAGRAIGRGLGGLLGAEDPMLARQSAENKLLQDVQSSMSPEDIQDPYKLSAAVYQAAMQANMPELANHAYQNMQAGKLANAKVGTEQAQAAKYTAEAANKQAELLQEQQASQALQKLYKVKQELGQVPTTEEIIATAAPFMPAEKLATMMQTSADKAAYRQTMMDQAEKALEARIEAAKQRQEDAKVIEQMRIDGRKEIAALVASLNPKSSSSSSVYERGYANQALNSFNELVPAFDNISILTNKGINPLTGSAFSGLKGTGFMSASGQQLGQIMTTSDQAQYESIMGPAAYNVAVLQAGGRVPRQTQIDNITNKLLSKGDTVPHIAQLQKLGELRQIVEQANHTYQSNPAASDEQKAMAQQAVDTYKQAIPFTGTDVAKFSVYSKKNPTVQFKDWLKVNGSIKETVAPASAIPEGAITKLKGNPSLAADFDAKFGAGASKRILGK